MKKIVRLTFLAALFTVFLTATASAAYEDVYAQKKGPGNRGWYQNENAWVYFGEGGVLKGWAEIGDKWYWFDQNGSMVTGWKNVDGTDYYFTETTGNGYPAGSCQNPYGGDLVPATNPQGQAVTASGQEAVPEVNPYGHTCVEVNLTQQFIRVWQDENLVITGPCVTGYKGVHDTSAGDFVINSKETDRYLQGYNDNGTRYKSYVNFWMPFNGGQGLHDAGWRGTSHENFGRDIYAWNGSHGCVNLPYDVAAALYNIAYVGMPVHTHY